jgi:hypothetical protein
MDSLGEDLNKVPNLTLLSFASRLKFGITGPDAFGAKTSALMEFDFTARAQSGAGTTASVRFRQAWVKLSWANTDLLVGRAWHPMVATDVLPSVMALSIGAPFQPFNRSEQITLTRKSGHLNLILSAIYQNDYINNGPGGKSFSYQNNSLVPNLHVQVKYKTDKLIVGAAVDYKRLKPRTFVTSPVDQEKTATDVGINSLAYMLYGQFKTGKLTVSGKTIVANNMSESLMPGAFGISSYDTLTGREEYTNFRHFFIWGNVSYGDKLKCSLFGGYFMNLGAAKNLVSAPNELVTKTIFGAGENIANMIRIVPTISYTSGKVIVALELEENIAAYGSNDYNDKGKVKNTSSVSGTRVLATMYYNF